MNSYDIYTILFTFIIVYPYLLYPLILRVLSACLPMSHVVDDSFLPDVTMIISAFNEEAVIREKLENALSLDYPREKLTILVVSDCSTDATEDIVKQFSDSGVHLLRTPERNGKTSGLNRAMEMISSEIVIFSDANAIYDRSAIRHLVKNFANEKVGYVVGHARYQNADSSAAGDSENQYWNFEVLLKSWESRFSSVVGGDGAIYAIRSCLWEPLLETDINDFVNPLQIVAKGYRGIFEPSAWCTEAPAGDFDKEFERKKRIVNRSFNGLLRVSACLNPLKVGRFSFLVISHKMLRWFSPYFLLLHWLLIIGGALGAGQVTGPYLAILTAYYLGFLLALLGDYQKLSTTGKPHKIFYLPYYLFLVNLSSALGVVLRLKGQVIYRWKTVRDQSGVFASGSPCRSVLTAFQGVSLVILVVGIFMHVAEDNVFSYFLVMILFYLYFGYPSVLALFAVYRSAPVIPPVKSWPSLSLLIVAYNEDAWLEDKINNSLALDYPPQQLNIVVVSDGSTDATNKIIATYAQQGISAKIFPVNRGKISALNEAMASIDSELVVLSDANVMYDSQALKNLARHFSDEKVGCVSGRVVLLNNGLSYENAENSYYGFEHFIQYCEGATGSMVGADGAMYAIRKDLFTPPVPETILDDFVISMQIACLGYKVLHDNQAIGYERNSNEIGLEFKRKARIIAGGIQVLKMRKVIPSLFRPLLLFKFISHKFLRWLSGPLCVLLFVILLWQEWFAVNDLFLTLLLGLFGVGSCVALITHKFPTLRSKPVLNQVYYQYMLLLASLVGFWKGLTNRQTVTWKQN